MKNNLLDLPFVDFSLHFTYDSYICLFRLLLFFNQLFELSRCDLFEQLHGFPPFLSFCNKKTKIGHPNRAEKQIDEPTIINEADKSKRTLNCLEIFSFFPAPCRSKIHWHLSKILTGHMKIDTDNET